MLPFVGIDTAVIVAALSSGAAVGSLLTAVRAWLGSRRQQPHIKVTLGEDRLELNLDDPEQAERFMRVWLSRHAPNDRESAG